MISRVKNFILWGLIIVFILPANAQAASFSESLPTIQVKAPASPSDVPPAGYYDSLIQYSTITNCVSIIQGSPYQEYGAGTFVGYYADPANGIPSPNSVYYIRVVIAGLGNACSGMRAYFELQLPTFTTFAVDGINKIICLYDNAPLIASDCPQTVHNSSYNPGASAYLSVDAVNAYTWPIPQGHILEVRFPVRSSSALTNSALRANVWMLDGNSSPWLYAQTGVYVFSNQSNVFYPSVSTTQITSSSAYSVAYLYATGAGTAYFDLGTTPAYGILSDSLSISGAGSWKAWDDWLPYVFQPDTTYHWRLRFVPNVGSPIYGNDQSFHTLPDGRVVVGNGLASDCSETALGSALSTAKEIQFNCGMLPITITLTSPKTITSNVVINGNNRIVFNGAVAGSQFSVQAGAHLTLQSITLSGSNNTNSCGGAVLVNSGGGLTLNGVRLINNHSNYQGGALCNWGTADIASSIFNNNTSSSHGGAIGNYANLTINGSSFSGNKANANGGAIDMGGFVDVTNSSFTNNTSLWRGGGINTYGGNLTLTNSSFSGNQAGMYGGGVANDASNATVNGTTFFNNTSSSVGGGLEMGGAGKLSLINTTFAGNHAATDGGGIYWTPGAGTGALSLINISLVGNQAGGAGGNIYAGGAANPVITLKNTLLAAGLPNNCDHAVTSLGFNLESANTCGFSAGGDKINRSPQLGSLAGNGGSTLTFLPLAGSPLIDGGTNAGCPAVDQRGAARPVDGNNDGSAVCDIGAVEAAKYYRVTLPYVKK